MRDGGFGIGAGICISFHRGAHGSWSKESSAGRLSLLLAKQIIFGTEKFASDSKEEPSTPREQVTSPNGTTAAAFRILMSDDSRLLSLLGIATDAARQRSIELGA